MTVKTDSTECKRAASMLDTLVANKSLTKLSVFTPDFVKNYTGKVLLMPGPAWFAGAIFNNPESLNVPKGRLGVAAPLAWDGDSAVAGNVGGGTWFISSHSKNLANAAKFAEFVTTDDAYQVNLGSRIPGVLGGRRQVGRQAGVAPATTPRDLSGLTDGRRPGLGRLGIPILQPGGDLGQDHHPAGVLGQVDRGNLGDLGHGDQEPGEGQRLPGQ